MYGVLITVVVEGTGGYGRSDEIVLESYVRRK